MCDFAVGIGARYLKLGGPRRGDRIAKYNQLIRLDSAFGSGEQHPLVEVRNRAGHQGFE
jgi:enolase